MTGSTIHVTPMLSSPHRRSRSTDGAVGAWTPGAGETPPGRAAVRAAIRALARDGGAVFRHGQLLCDPGRSQMG